MVSDEGVLSEIEELLNNSKLILSSFTNEIKEDRNLDETVKLHSDLMLTHLSTKYSIAISRLFAVRIIFLY